MSMQSTPLTLPRFAWVPSSPASGRGAERSEAGEGQGAAPRLPTMRLISACFFSTRTA
jgi:hypothetical protein